MRIPETWSLLTASRARFVPIVTIPTVRRTQPPALRDLWCPDALGTSRTTTRRWAAVVYPASG